MATTTYKLKNRNFVEIQVNQDYTYELFNSEIRSVNVSGSTLTITLNNTYEKSNR